MTESEWLTETRRPWMMVQSLLAPGKVQRTKAGKRKLRLFACGCCRLIWELLPDPRTREAVKVAERFAEGQASKDELQAAFQSVIGLTMGGYSPTDPGVQERTAARMALASVKARAMSAAFDMTALPLPLAGYCAGEASGDVLLCDLLHCVFGNPFRPISLDHAWLAWNDGTVRTLAQSIYDDRAFDRLPILADALEEAGCKSTDILNHCRGPGPHARGCWVVDLILGEQ
jgi:hypothetical protein